MSASPIQEAATRFASDEDVDTWLDSLTDEEILALRFDWLQHARPAQLPPDGDDWRGWLILAGRGSGKTRAGAEWVIADLQPDDRIALVAPTAADARDVMVNGESGILACSPPWNLPEYKPSQRVIEWPNGAIATTYSAEEPDRLRGPQHTRAWCDEVAAWRYGWDTWAMLMMTLRLGDNPRWCATTTPKPVRLIREMLVADNVVITRMTSYENAPNLPRAFLDEIVTRYEGTRLGRQELLAELLDDVPGALWTRDGIERLRTKNIGNIYYRPRMVRIVVAVDPAVTSGEDADSTGIIVVGKGEDGRGYVLEDLTCRKSPKQWAWDVVNAYEKWDADRVVAEVNNGGELVETVLRAVNAELSYKAVHASRGKRTRAEPIAALYEQGRVRHAGTFPDLEDQMCMYVPDAYEGSPDRVDALVWGLSEMMLDKPRSRFAFVGAEM